MHLKQLFVIIIFLLTSICPSAQNKPYTAVIKKSTVRDQFVSSPYFSAAVTFAQNETKVKEKFNVFIEIMKPKEMSK